MFEKILEKILLNYFGKYLTGFDKNNLKLGVWSGNVVIENMMLKPEVIANLELPINILHSMIGRLVINVPWNKLSSSPVEVTIEDVLLIVVPKDPRDWKFSDEILVQKQLNSFLNFAQQQLEKFLDKKKKKESDDSGYFNKLTLKVLDNLQLQIKNIHLRWEAKDASDLPYAWGIRLDSLEAFTTNTEWTKNFIDRTDEKNREAPMNKLLQLTNLKIYWNSQESNFFPSNTYEQMSEIININATFKLVQNARSVFDQPLYDFSIDLEWITIMIKHAQLKQAIRMLENITLYTKLLWIQRKTVRAVKYNQEEYQQQFEILFTRIQRTGNKNLDQQESELMAEILRSVEYEVLLDWVQKIMKNIILESKVQEMQKKNKKGWFGWGASQPTDEQQTSEQEIKEIETYIETTLAKETEAFQSESIVRPQNSQRYTVNFRLKGASVFLVKEDITDSIDGARLICHDIRLSWSAKQNRDFATRFSLLRVGFELIQQGNRYIPLCFQAQEYFNKQLGNGFFTLQIQKNTASKQDKDTADLNIICKIDPVTFVYNPAMIRLFRDFKKVKKGNVDEALKSATWERLESIQDQTQSKVQIMLASALKIDLDVQIQKVRVLLPGVPISAENSTFTNSSGWQFYMEQIKITSFPPSNEDLYDGFKIQLLESSFIHGISQKSLPEKVQIQCQNFEHNVVEKYSLEVDLKRIKTEVKNLIRQQDENIPSLLVDVNLGEVHAQLSEQSQKDLVYLPEAVFPHLNQTERLELLSEEKATVMKNSTISGWAKSRGKHIPVWTRVYLVLSEAYLYFYDNEAALIAQQTVYIKNSAISKLNEEIQEEWAFSITNRYDYCYLSFENEKLSNEWSSILLKKIEEFSTEGEFIRRKGVLNDDEQEHVSRGPLIKLSGKLEKAELTVWKNNYKDKINHILMQNVVFEWRRAADQQTYKIQLKNLIVEDWYFEFEYREFQKFIIMEAPQDQNCLCIEAISLKPSSKNYQKVDLQINIMIQNVICNWKPDTMLKFREWFILLQERKSRQGYYANLRDYEVDAFKEGSINLPQDLQRRKLEDAMKDSLRKCELYNDTNIRQRDDFDYLIDYEGYTKNFEYVRDKFIRPNYQQQTFQKLGSVIIQLKCVIQSAKIKFFQRQSHAQHFEIDIQRLSILFRKLQYCYFLDGSLKCLSAYDTTNYPFSVDSNLEWDKVKPYCLIGARPGFQNDEIAHFKFAGYDELILVSADRSNVLLSLQINPALIHYQHQPIMRIIDYILVQIVSLIKEPEYLTMNADFIEQQNSKKNWKLKARKVWGDLDDIFKRFICPTFLDIRISLIKPLLIIKGWLHFTEYFQIQTNEIKIFNGQQRDPSRITKKGGEKLIQGKPNGFPDGRIEQAWTETYYIQALGLQLLYKDQIRECAFSQPLDFNLSFERVLHVNEVQAVFPIVQYDKSLKIRSAMTPLIIKAFKEEYLQICRFIFHNFQYDDQMDKIYIHDFEVVRSFEPSPISFFLDFQSLTIFPMSLHHPDYPIARITMEEMRLKFLKFPDQNVQLSLEASRLGMYQYKKLSDGQYMETAFAGDLTQQSQFLLQNLQDGFDLDRAFFQKLIQQQDQYFDTYEFKDFKDRQFQFSLNFHILRPSADKNIYIKLDTLKLLVEPAVLANVGLWSLLDQKCWPPQNDFVSDIPSIKLFTEIRNASLCFPGDEQAMATKGEISYVYYRQRMPNPQGLIQQIQESKKCIRRIEDAFEHKVTLMGLELFKCELQDYLVKPIETVHKRNVVMPFSFFMGIKNELNISNGPNPQIYFYNKYETNFDKTVLKFSYQDLIVGMGIAKYYKQQSAQIKREPEEQKINEEQAKQPEQEINNYYDMVVHGMQIVIINDAGEAYVPVFDLTIYESQVIYHQTRQKSILSMVLSVSSTFYNPKIAVWEPIIEKTSFALDMSLNAKSNPKKYIILEMNSPQDVLNINISAQMLSVFHRTILSWKQEMTGNPGELKQQQSFYNRMKSSESSKFTYSQLEKDKQFTSINFEEDIDRKEINNSNIKSVPIKMYTISNKYGEEQKTELESVDHVSPYTIRNETGYVIEVENDTEEEQKQLYLLQPGGSTNYQIDADIEQLFLKDGLKGQRLIRFHVKHPLYTFTKVANIDLDSFRNKSVAIRTQNNKSYNLVIECVPKDTRKVLLVSSEVIVFNKTDQSIILQLFENDDHKYEKLLVEPDKAQSLPFDRTKGFLQFKFDSYEDNNFSDLIDLKLMSDLNDRSYEFKHSNNYFTLVRCFRRNCNQTMLYLEPPYTIKNCLPLKSIEYELLSDEHSIIENSTNQQELEFSKISNYSAQTQNSDVLIQDQVNYCKYPQLNLQQIQRGVLYRQQQIQIHSVSTRRRLAIKIKLPFYQWSDIGMLYNPYAEKLRQNPKNHIYPIQDTRINMCDYRGINSNSVAINTCQSGKGRSFQFYTSIFTVNDSDQQLYFFYNPTKNIKGAQLCSGQKLQNFDLDDQTEITIMKFSETKSKYSLGYFSLHDDIQVIQRENLMSREVSLTLTGNYALTLPDPQRTQLFEFGVNVSLICVDQSQSLFSTVLTVSPRYVFVNYTQYDLQVAQEGCSNHLTIKSQERQTFHWARADYKKHFKVKITENSVDSYWCYSQALNPETTGITCFIIRNEKNRSNVRYLRCQSRQEDQIIYQVFQECKPLSNDQKEVGEVPYGIVNQLNDITLVCYQLCMIDPALQGEYKFQEYKVILPPQSEMPFAWEFPMEKKDIKVELRFEGELQGVFEQEPFEIPLDEADLEKEIILYNEEQDKQLKFYIASQWEGQAKRLKFFQEEGFLERQRDEDSIELQLGVSLNQVGISVIDFEMGKRIELLYLTLKNVEFMILETKVLRTSQLKIKYINMDNNSSTRTMFPVIITPTKYKEIFEFDRPHLSLVIVQSIQVQSLSFIKSIRACILPTTIRLTSGVLEQLYMILKTTQNEFQNNASYDSQKQQLDFEYVLEYKNLEENENEKKAPILTNQVQLKYGRSLIDPNKQYFKQWQEAELPLQAKTTYIDRIEIYPLYFTLTFYNSVRTNKQSGTIIQLAKKIGISVADVDEAPVQLKGIYLENCFDTSAGITKKLITHYKDNIIQQLLKVIGSIEIIGNPVGLIKHIMIGIYDFFDKPIEGFIKGPIEGGIGITKGIGSLVKNTVSGTCNSVGKIVGSFAGGLAFISMDPEFQSQREKIRMEKPRQIVDGVKQGFLLLAQGVTRGVVGVVQMPVEGAKTDGAAGGFTGVLKGTTGFFVKPLAGLLDFGSKTAEGIKASAMYWDDKANEKRERDIRVMYATEQFYKGYNQKDAQIIQYLQTKWKEEFLFTEVYFYDAFYLENRYDVLVLSFQMILLADIRRKLFQWKFESKNLINVEYTNTGIAFTVKQQGQNNVQIEVNCVEPILKRQIIEKTKWLISAFQNN